MNRRRTIIRAVVWTLVALAAAAAPLLSRAAPPERLQGFGIVYLHGKAGWPGGFNGGILSALADEGALIAKPEMPWSFHRRYGATYDQAMEEIDGVVAALKAKGAVRIVVIGHSLGANAAIGYAARHSDVAGVVALAPAHLPETGRMRSFVSDALARAKKLVAAGEGDVPQTFPDMAQGIPLVATATPVVYLSMFDPDGPAVIPKNAAAIGAAAHPPPLLWVAGKLDPIDRRGPAYAFDAAAKNPKSEYIEVFADHLTTPLAARKQVVDWINSL
ncbi:MAG TPA: alpha/beta hydrolase [Xanthobacteraceae bacterium]|nr:alpha/beta hydrolase [Xanthobacteraceae bacterium]